MSSLAGKMSELVDEYNHSKTSPAYRKLNIKYKALKKTNQELIQLLSTLISGANYDCGDHIRKLSKKSQTDNILEDNLPHEELEVVFSSNDMQESVPVDLHEDQDQDQDSESYEKEELVESCDEEDETEDPDIQEQNIQEQIAESFAIIEEEVVVEVEEEVVVEEVEEEVVEEEEVVVEEVEEEEMVEEEEEEAGVYEIEVKGTRYYTTNEKDGIVYAVLEDDDVGDEIGKFVNGKLVLN